jgi:ankyrin repeat protein
MHHVFLSRHENPNPDVAELSEPEAKLDWWWNTKNDESLGTLRDLRHAYRQALSTNEASEGRAPSEKPSLAEILRSLAIRRPLPLHQILGGQDAKDGLMDEFLSLVVERALELGANISARDQTGKAALAIAAESGMSNVVVTLLEGGSEPELRDDKNMTALHHAARNGNLEVAQFLLWAKDHYPLGMTDKDGLTPLVHAARNSHESIAKFIIAYIGYDLLMDVEFRILLDAELREDEQVTALKHLGTLWPTLKNSEPDDHPFVTCLRKEKFQLATEFITSDVFEFDYAESGWDLCSARSGFLPLAARYGKRQVVERLLEKHVIPILQLGFAMIVAAMWGYTDILQLLIEDERVKADTVGENIKRVRKEAERLIATKIVTIDTIDRNANHEGTMTPLMFAAKHGQQEIVVFLTDLGLGGLNFSFPDLKTESFDEGHEPLLGLAAGCVDNVIGQLQILNEPPLSNGDVDTIAAEARARAENILKRLLDHFWDHRSFRSMLNWQDADQQTALMIAVKKDLESGVKMLLESGADQSLTNKEGKTARHIAEEHGNSKIITLFGTCSRTEEVSEST